MNPQTNATPGLTQEAMSFEDWWFSENCPVKSTVGAREGLKQLWDIKEAEIASLREQLEKVKFLLNELQLLEQKHFDKLLAAEARISALTTAGDEMANCMRTYLKNHMRPQRLVQAWTAATSMKG